MNLYCVELTLWKRIMTCEVRPSLKLACWLIVVLGGMLFTNEPHAQTACEGIASYGARVVVKNVNNPSTLNVRSTPNTESSQNIIDTVSNGNQGIVSRAPEIEMDGDRVKYVWYYVRWGHTEGWSAGIIYGEKFITTIAEANLKEGIVEALFNGENRDKNSRNYIHHYQTRHDYNDYKCNANFVSNGERVYGAGGHAGWDVRTKDERARPFFSLTAGTVKFKSKCKTIAVFDGDMTTLYLHAEDIAQDIKNGKTKRVSVGHELGTQGETCVDIPTKPHVHIEVREGNVSGAAYSADQTTINLIPYLCEWLNGVRGKRILGDVNRDGRVSFFGDCLMVMETVIEREYVIEHDLNCDGEVNWDDVDIVWANRTAWLAPAANADAAPPANQTLLLPNYPNPFNPDTWIPYALAEDANVMFTIYDIQGTEVRRFDLGHQPAGYYIDKRRSIYWDGRNMLGEQVVSGVYFYRLQAGNYSAMRRMVISK